MEARYTFTVSWCNKHKNWWITNCPDCMVDSNEESIKQAGRREVVEWVNININTDSRRDEWQAQLKEWGIGGENGR